MKIAKTAIGFALVTAASGVAQSYEVRTESVRTSAGWFTAEVTYYEGGLFRIWLYDDEYSPNFTSNVSGVMSGNQAFGSIWYEVHQAGFIWGRSWGVASCDTITDGRFKAGDVFAVATGGIHEDEWQEGPETHISQYVLEPGLPYIEFLTPEPCSLLLLAIGGLAMVGRRDRAASRQ